MSLIAIDPGVHRCACVALDDDRLVEVWFETAKSFAKGDALPASGYARSCGTAVIVVEQPQVDARTRTSTREVVALAWHGALLAGEFAGRDAAPVVAVTPSVWKGTEPKPQHHARLWAVLSAAERAILGGAETERRIFEARRRGALTRWSKPGASFYGRWDGHNLLDAAALALWYVNRLEKR